MRIKTPSFWYPDPGADHSVLALLLAPLSGIYDTLRRNVSQRTAPYISALPVICVGNLVAGGSGKTPVALSIMKLVKESGIAPNPCFLTRGYGGSAKDGTHVDPSRHSFLETGDEALLLAQEADTFISGDRRAGAKTIEAHGGGLIVMDDGFQNPSLAKTVSFVVVSGPTGFGNGRLFPAGPLREPVAEGLERASAVVIAGEDRHNVRSLVPAGKPVFSAHLRPAAPIDPTRRYHAFTGLGWPRKFRDTLEQCGVNLTGFSSFPDHYPYTYEDLRFISLQAEKGGAHLLTTEKDCLRIPQEWRTQFGIGVLPVEIAWEDKAALEDFIRSRL